MSVVGNFFPSMLRRRSLSSFRPRNIIWNFSGFAIIPFFESQSNSRPRQGRRKHLKLGVARHFEGTFFLRNRRHFLKIKRALLCLLQNLGGTFPQCPPVPTSMDLQSWTKGYETSSISRC